MVDHIRGHERPRSVADCGARRQSTNRDIHVESKRRYRRWRKQRPGTYFLRFENSVEAQPSGAYNMTIDIEEETAAPTVPPGYCHQFHADVSALHGEFRAPIRQRIESHIPITLNDRRGGHLTRYVEDINIEGLIFVKRAFTRVSGSISEKYGAWVTLAATVLEGVNFLEVLTADRVVAQVSTEHAFRDGHVPRVSFLGTKFENLKINGIPVGIEYDFDVCGPRPARDQPYNTNEAFTAQARERINEIANSEFLFGRARTNYA